MKILARCLLLPIIYFPTSWLPELTSVLAFLARKLAKKEQRILESNIQHIFGLPADRGFGQMFARQVTRHQILTALESIQGIFRPHLVTLDGGEESFARVMSGQNGGNKGQILITAHLGSWELLGRYCRLVQPRAFHVLAKPARSKLSTHILAAIRDQMGTPVFWTDRRMIQRQMLQTLHKGDWLGFVMDQKPEGRKGPEVSFFGIPTPFVGGPGAMVARTGASLTAAFCLRVGPLRYRLVAIPLLKPGHGEMDEVVITQMCASQMESVIRQYPEQWCWNYKRWIWR